jgi:hypothetical protein
LFWKLDDCGLSGMVRASFCSSREKIRANHDFLGLVESSWTFCIVTQTHQATHAHVEPKANHRVEHPPTHQAALIDIETRQSSGDCCAKRRYHHACNIPICCRGSCANHPSLRRSMALPHHWGTLPFVQSASWNCPKWSCSTHNASMDTGKYVLL